MTKTVIILGANGRFGRAAADAFLAAGWQVRCFARSRPDGPSTAEWVAGDAFDVQALVVAATGSDVIVNVLNPPYHRWRCDLPRLTANVIVATPAKNCRVKTAVRRGRPEWRCICSPIRSEERAK